MRNFFCPECDAPSLEIAQSISLCADARSDEIDVQLVRCAGCAFAGIAIYTESRRGALDDESWEHCGYRVTPSVIEIFSSMLVQCPAAQNHRCRCYAHDHLGAHSPDGYWCGIPELADAAQFAMRFA